MKKIVYIALGCFFVVSAMEEPDIESELSEWEEVSPETEPLVGWEEISPEFESIDLATDSAKLDAFVKKLAFSTKNRELIDHKKLIAHGGRLLEQIIEGKSIAAKEAFSEEQRKEYLSNILALIWLLYSYAVEKDQGFTEGALIVQDPSKFLYNYLYTYVQKVSSEQEEGLIPYATINCYAYKYPEAQDDHDVYGIDMRWDQNEQAQPVLPNAKSHLFFRNRSDGFVEIFMSDTGLCYWDGFTSNLAQATKKGFTGWLEQYVGRKENPLEHNITLPSLFSDRLRELEQSELWSYSSQTYLMLKQLLTFIHFGNPVRLIFKQRIISFLMNLMLFMIT